MRNVIELLRAAVAELKTDGWIQGDLHGGDIKTSPHCALGGLEAALYEEFGPSWASDDKANSLYERAQGFLDEVAFDEGFDGIVELNDSDSTTFARVRAAFTSAITRAKGSDA